MAEINPLWVWQFGSLDRSSAGINAFVQQLVSDKFNAVAMIVGGWDINGQGYLEFSAIEYKNWIAAVKAINPTIKFIIGLAAGNPDPKISDRNVLYRMLEIIPDIQNLGADTFISDFEYNNQTTATLDFVAFLHAHASKAHSLGMESEVYYGIDYPHSDEKQVLPELNDQDLAVIRFSPIGKTQIWPSGETIDTAPVVLEEIKSLCSCKWIPQLRCGWTNNEGETVQSSIDFYKTATEDGSSLWAYPLSSEDRSQWVTWVIGTPPEHTNVAILIAASPGGTTDPAPNTYYFGSNSDLVVTAIPEAEYIFKQFLIGSIVTPATVNPYTLHIYTQNDSIIAEFNHVEPPPPPPPDKKTLAARVPSLGNKKLVQIYLRKIRDHLFNKRLRELLHPVI